LPLIFTGRGAASGYKTGSAMSVPRSVRVKSHGLEREAIALRRRRRRKNKTGVEHWQVVLWKTLNDEAASAKESYTSDTQAQ
jgi:hypothetical protein